MRKIVELIGGPWDGFLYEFSVFVDGTEPTIVAKRVAPEGVVLSTTLKEDSPTHPLRFPLAYYERSPDGVYRHTHTAKAQVGS